MELVRPMAAQSILQPFALPGSILNPILDSFHGEEVIFKSGGKDCPKALLDRQRLISVDYLGFDGSYHRGQIVIHKDLVQDVLEIFSAIRKLRFPLQSVIPIGDRRFSAEGDSVDECSMTMNNSSGFHYRTKTGKKDLSRHALGLAMDLNPRLNPYMKAGEILPKNGIYCPHRPGTLHRNHPLVHEFKRLGWTWGGDWISLKDFQHFEKPLNPLS